MCMRNFEQRVIRDIRKVIILIGLPILRVLSKVRTTPNYSSTIHLQSKANTTVSLCRNELPYYNHGVFGKGDFKYAGRHDCAKGLRVFSSSIILRIHALALKCTWNDMSVPAAREHVAWSHTSIM
ncbi:hypothetical protein EYC80_004099 [Monilinia laxa]|uniref:Uncharacterized protein n=1 Tax=Monilinia laxa TaxID=61186 RepID=A0A5N6KM32_MONLA|nr:hypothetical protein EYC80_004099 [Monilinia laxa]